MTPHDGAADAAARHWDEIYATRDATDVSWYQREPGVSLRLIEANAAPTSSVVDVGGGLSVLVDRLIERGYGDVTVLDVSSVALERVRERVGSSSALHLVASDVRAWRPTRRYDLWHDRAVLHFLTDPADRARYVEVVRGALAPEGRVVLGVFSTEGPTHCSGLEVQRYGVEDLVGLFGPGFALQASEHERHVTPSGAEQDFIWVVLARAADAR